MSRVLARLLDRVIAGGNGDQAVIGVPELDLVVAIFGSAYSDRVPYRVGEEGQWYTLRIPEDIIPRYILRAIGGAETPR